MISAAKRCLGGMLAALALCAAGLCLIASPPSAALEVCLLAAFALAAFAGVRVLAPLRTDLVLIEALCAERAEQATPAPARSVESRALLDALLALKARSAELEASALAARGEVEAAERLRVSFLAAMGHDLRGPLNAVIGFSDLLLMDEHDAVAPAQRPSIELIRQSSGDLLVLLDQVLQWAKLETGQVTLKRELVALPVLLADAAREATSRSGNRGLRVELAIEGELGALTADRERLLQALLSLMDHATRITPGPRLRLSARRIDSAHAQVTLHDPQLRIREADRASFFEALRPSYAPSGKRHAGLGLGPALARALIRAHGGEVSFASESHGGTTFTLALPVDGG